MAASREQQLRQERRAAARFSHQPEWAGSLERDQAGRTPILAEKRNR